MNHPQLHDLTALAYNMVEGTEREQLLEHVNHCDACREVYDSYMEEQALVRDVLFRDARSGPAEARALEKTLLALAEADADTSRRGRIFRIITWPVVAQVAAVLVLALGLMVFLKPPAKPDPNEVIAILPENQAPGRVVSGELMVPAQGQWQRADAMPANEWVMSTGQAPLTLAFPGGATASLDPQCVFRLSTDEGESQPVLYMLHGNGSYVAGDKPDVFCVRWRDGEFVPMAGAQIQFDARYAESSSWQPDAQAVRGWMAAKSMNVHVKDGKGIYLPVRGGMMPGVLVAGEGLDFGPDRARLMRDGKKDFELLIEIDVSAGTQSQFDLLRVRMADIKTGSQKVDEQLRRRLEEAQRMANAFEFRPVGGKGQSVIMRKVEVDNARKTAEVRKDGLHVIVEGEPEGLWSVTVFRDSGLPEPEFSSFQRRDINSLRKELPDDVRDMFDQAVESLNRKPK